MKVYIVVGGCFGDFHIIDVYSTSEAAQERATKANAACDGLGAYVEEYSVLS